MICLPLPISEYLIYKFPEESNLSAEEVTQKRHKELLKNNQTYAFFNKRVEAPVEYLLNLAEERLPLAKEKKC